MSRTAIAVRNWIVRVHRWTGVACCVLFLAWFSSGIVPIYCPFPHVQAENRLAHEDSLDPGRIHIPPAGALAALGESAPPTQMRLRVLDAYRSYVGGVSGKRGAGSGIGDSRRPVDAGGHGTSL